MPPLRERPDGRPVDLRIRVEAWRHEVVGMTARVDPLCIVQLPVAEQLHFIRGDGFGLSSLLEIRKTSPAADFVAVKGAGVALDRLAKGAGLRLRRRAALPRALAPQTPSQ